MNKQTLSDEEINALSVCIGCAIGEFGASETTDLANRALEKIRGLRAAVAAEREQCQKAVCYGCRQDAPYVNGMHEIPDDVTHPITKTRWVNCTALAIRARGQAESGPRVIP